MGRQCVKICWFISASSFESVPLTNIVHLGTLAVDILPDEGIIGESREVVASIMKVTSVMVGLWLWGLSMWFFFVSVGSLFKYL